MITNLLIGWSKAIAVWVPIFLRLGSFSCDSSNDPRENLLTERRFTQLGVSAPLKFWTAQMVRRNVQWISKMSRTLTWELFGCSVLRTKNGHLKVSRTSIWGSFRTSAMREQAVENEHRVFLRARRPFLAPLHPDVVFVLRSYENDVAVGSDEANVWALCCWYSNCLE